MAFLLCAWEMCANRYLKEFNRTWIWLPPHPETNFLYSFAALLKSPETGGVALPHSLGLDLISCLIQRCVEYYFVRNRLFFLLPFFLLYRSGWSDDLFVCESNGIVS